MCFGRAQDTQEAKQEHGQDVTAGSGGSYNTKGSGLVNGTKSSGAPRSTHSRARTTFNVNYRDPRRWLVVSYRRGSDDGVNAAARHLRRQRA